MLTETVTAIIKDLQRFYKPMNESQQEFYRSQLLAFDEDDLCTAIVAMKGKESTGYVPSIATIRKYYWEAREIRLTNEKAQAPTFQDLKRNQTTSHGQESIKLMQDLYNGTLTREQYILGMLEMGKKYPGIGWQEAAQNLRRGSK